MDYRKKIFRAGGTSALMIALVLAVAVVLNLVVGQLPSTWTKWDVSTNALYTVSQQTKDITTGLQEDVTLTLVAQTGQENDTLLELLRRYEAMSSRIKVAVKDPVLYPYYTAQYTSDQVYNNSVVVESGKRSKFVSYTDIYQVSYNADYSTNTSFNGESAITSAISYVTSETLPKVYLLEGHGEKELSSAMQKTIEQNNLMIDSLNLLTVEAIPDEVDCLVINGPTADLTREEAGKLGSFLRNGGRMLLFTDYSDVEMPNLIGVMEGFGVTQQRGLIIEGDSSYCLQGYAHYLLPEIVGHAITQPLLTGSHFVLTPLVHGIAAMEDAPENVTVSPLLTTSKSSYLKPAGYKMETMEKEPGDSDGPFHVGVALSQTREDGETRIVWFATTELLDETADAMVSGGNQDLILNSLSWMVDQEDQITIHAKSLNSDYLTVSAFDAGMWSVLMIAVLPLVLLITGGVVWYRRKKR